MTNEQYFFSRCWSRTENICKVYASFSNFARCSMLWKLYFGYNGRIWAVAYVVSSIYCNKRNNWRCHILCTLFFKRSGKHDNNEDYLRYILKKLYRQKKRFIDNWHLYLLLDQRNVSKAVEEMLSSQKEGNRCWCTCRWKRRLSWFQAK